MDLKLHKKTKPAFCGLLIRSIKMIKYYVMICENNHPKKIISVYAENKNHIKLLISTYLESNEYVSKISSTLKGVEK